MSLINDDKYLEIREDRNVIKVRFAPGMKTPRRLEGSFKTKEDAIAARDKWLKENGYGHLLSLRDNEQQAGVAEVEVDNHFFLVAFSDSHGGHNQGLLNPNTVLDDEGGFIQPKLTKMQVWLWNLYNAAMDKVFDIAGDPSKIVLAHLGDLTQGNKYSDNHVSSRLSDQIVIAYWNLKPWFERGVKKAILLKGTGSHAFGDGSSGLLINELIKAKYSDVSIKTVYHALLQLGIEIDLAHHGPHPGTRQWTKGNIARYYLLDRMMEALASGEESSRLFLRGHYHQYCRESLHRYGKSCDLVVLPSFCGLGAYGHQATKSINKTQHGMVVFEIKNNRLKDIYPIVEKYDVRVKISL